VDLQHSVGSALLWSACRRRLHVGEDILTQVFNDLHREVSKSPEATVSYFSSSSLGWFTSMQLNKLYID